MTCVPDCARSQSSMFARCIFCDERLSQRWKRCDTHSQVRRAASDAPVLSVLSVRVTTGMFIV